MYMKGKVLIPPKRKYYRKQMVLELTTREPGWFKGTISHRCSCTVRFPLDSRQHAALYHAQTPRHHGGVARNFTKHPGSRCIRAIFGFL